MPHWGLRLAMDLLMGDSHCPVQPQRAQAPAGPQRYRTLRGSERSAPLKGGGHSYQTPAQLKRSDMAYARQAGKERPRRGTERPWARGRGA